MPKKPLFLFSLLIYIMSSNPILPLLAQNHESAQTIKNQLEETDIWTPSDVRENRNRIIKQTELARVIAQFPNVEKAEVFINDSGQHRLSTMQPEASASVYVKSSSGIKDKDRLALTITEFVSGANRNMNRSDVRVVINGELISAPKYPQKLYFSNRQFLQNSLTYTNRPLDLGIKGSGYFRLRINRTIVDEKGNTRTQQDEGYTRLGRLGIGVDGNLILDSSRVYFLEPSLTFHEGSNTIFIREDGIVLADVNGEREEIGQIALYRFINPSGLIKVASHIFVESERSGPPTEGTPGIEGFGSLAQGYMETQFISSDENVSQNTEAESLKEILVTLRQILAQMNQGKTQTEPIELKVPSDGQSFDKQSLIIRYDPIQSRRDYEAPAYCSLPDTDPYVIARGADKGLVRVVTENNKQLKKFIVPKEKIRAVVDVYFDKCIVEDYHFVFTEDKIILIHRSNSNAGIFSGCDIYELPYRRTSFEYRDLLANNSWAKELLHHVLGFYQAHILPTLERIH